MTTASPAAGRGLRRAVGIGPGRRGGSAGVGGPASPGPATVDVPLYAKREHIYQREVQGPWQKRRALLLFALAGFYIALPWLTWDGRQAVWFDVPARKFYLLGLTIWPQDFFFLAILLIIAALSLFFFTAVAGRLWCGYACPQTVWTKFFMWIEWLTEGDRNRRILLDRGPWTREKFLRKTAKHGGWLALSAVVGVTFVGYFVPVRELLPRLALLDISGGEAVFLAIASLALYADAGWMREQICLYACPYARFQGAMFDRHTLNISYDVARGEPRGSRSRSAVPAALGLGDCIDCKLCVHVCPTGIDIRDGAQYECIGCAACIDACDGVMEEVGYPKGLVRYASEAGLAGGATRVLRPRTVAYGALLAVLMLAFTVGLWTRVPLAMDVIRDRARLWRELPGGEVENVYTLRIMNKSQRVHTYALAVEGEAPITMIGPSQVDVEAGELKDVPVQVRAPRAGLPSASIPITFTVAPLEDPSAAARQESRFLSPGAAK